MSNEIHVKVFDTINKIERSQATHCEINKLWSEIKTLFLSELEKLPSIPVSFNKKQKNFFEKVSHFGITIWRHSGKLRVRWKKIMSILKSNLLMIKI